MVTGRRWAWILCGVLVAAGAAYASGQRPAPVEEQTRQRAALMLAKLASSQRVVDGLVTKDFDEIGRGASELIRICDATEWAARSNQVYAHHRTELRRQAQKLAKMATEKNLDGAAFTYMHTLTTCISCHEFCRDVLRIAEDSRPRNKIVPIPVNEEESIGGLEPPTRR